MNPSELRAVMDFLREKVHLQDHKAEGEVVIGFDTPTLDEMVRAGLDPEGSRQVLDASWWDEMAVDVVETPEVCEPDDPPEQVLQYAKDVISEYIRKRAEL